MSSGDGCGADGCNGGGCGGGGCGGGGSSSESRSSSAPASGIERAEKATSRGRVPENENGEPARDDTKSVKRKRKRFSDAETSGGRPKVHMG